MRAGLLARLLVEPRVLERDGGLAGERLGQLLVARAERPPGPERQHADRPITDLERDAEKLV